MIQQVAPCPQMLCYGMLSRAWRAEGSRNQLLYAVNEIALAKVSSGNIKKAADQKLKPVHLDPAGFAAREFNARDALHAGQWYLQRPPHDGPEQNRRGRKDCRLTKPAEEANAKYHEHERGGHEPDRYGVGK